MCALNVIKAYEIIIDACLILNKVPPKIQLRISVREILAEPTRENIRVPVKSGPV